MRQVINNASIIDTEKKEIRGGSLLIEDGIITAVSETPLPGDGADIIRDLDGALLCPSFIDPHIHIESSMLSPLEFARTAILHGTGTVMVDPHEIANVFGTKAVRLFLDLADKLPLDMFVAIPSCVPATDMENSGAVITVDDIKELIDDPRVYGLAEMMNFPGIIEGFGGAREKVDAAFASGKIIDGHCPGVTGDALQAYVTNGKNDGIVRIMNDHETSRPEEAIDKLQAGMYLALRQGSATRDMEAILPVLLREKVSLEKCMLCSDDLSAQELKTSGHVDRIIRAARDIFAGEGGLSREEATLQAIAMATEVPGRYLEKYLTLTGQPPLGRIAEGCAANFLTLESLETLSVESLYHRGLEIVQEGRSDYDPPAYNFSAFSGSVNVGKKIDAEDFHLETQGAGNNVTVRAIDIVAESLLTGTAEISLPVSDGIILPDPQQDTAMIAVFERHHATGSSSRAFVRGLGFSGGAIASTIAHDSHNLIVTGFDPKLMAKAANLLVEKGGGLALVTENESHYLSLEIGGLMTSRNIDAVINDYNRLKKTAKELGSPLRNIFMTLSFLSLPVIPELKLTDRGLVDVTTFSFTDLVVSQAG